MGVFSFDDLGQITDACILKAKGTIIYKVAVNGYHSVMPLSKVVIYFESKPGPFEGLSDSIFPVWAPDSCEVGAVKNYRKQLQQYLKERNI